MAKKALGPLFYHEALDRTSIAAEMVETLLLDHPAIKSNPKWHKRVTRAADQLWTLYQEIGAKRP
jgi:hypothetical protein